MLNHRLWKTLTSVRVFLLIQEPIRYKGILTRGLQFWLLIKFNIFFKIFSYSNLIGYISYITLKQKQMAKVELTKKELKERIKTEAKEMQADLKKQGANWPLSHCKREVEKTLRENCIII